tara:strand:- start:40 stop:1068 length:1029 start_codon:yes stop_codon:yes gene_type:complete
MAHSLYKRIGIFLAILTALIVSNPLHLKAIKKIGGKASFTESISNVFHQINNKSTQNYYLFSVKNTKTRGREIGCVTQWFQIDKNGFLGRVTKTRASHGNEDPYLIIFTINLTVLLFWSYMNRGYEPLWMSRHFTASRNNCSQGRIYTLLTSAISHADPLHFLVNCNLFYHVYNASYPTFMNQTELFLFLTSAGIFASSTSVLINNFVLKRRVELLGFSGCCYALLTFVIIKNPLIKWYFFGMTLSGVEFLVVNSVIDLVLRRNSVDPICHIGGVVYAYLWLYGCITSGSQFLCKPGDVLFPLGPPLALDIENRKWSLILCSLWFACGVTAMCMVWFNERRE